MTQTDFNHLLSSIKTLSPAQVRRLRQQLDRQLAEPEKPRAESSRKAAKDTRSTARKRKMTEAEFAQHLLKIGLVSSLPPWMSTMTIRTIDW